MNSSFLVACNQPGSFEHAQVLGDPGEGDVEGRGQVADGGFAAGQARQDAAASGVGQGGKDGIQPLLGILNHMV